MYGKKSQYRWSCAAEEKRLDKILHQRRTCFESLTHSQLRAYVRESRTPSVSRLVKKITQSSVDKVVQQLSRVRWPVPKMWCRSSKPQGYATPQ